LGPSPFEHWFESYLCFTVGSLHFSEIAFGSSFIYLSPSSLFLCRALPLLCPGHVRRPCRSRIPLHQCTCRLGLCPAASRPRAGSTSPPHVAAVCPSCASPPLAVAMSPAPPPASRRAHVPLTASPPPYRPCAVLLRVLHVALLLPELRRGCHACRRCQLLLAHGHLLFWTLSSSSSFPSTRPGCCTSFFPSFFPAPIAIALRTSAATPAHHRQPPPLLPPSNPKHGQHPHDPLKLTEQTNCKFIHQNRQTAAPASPLPPPPLGLPLTHRYRPSPARSTTPSAPHHSPEVIPPPLHRPPSP
jgi:hypothetical protein